MVRKRKETRKIGCQSEEIMKQALKMYDDGVSIRKTARHFKISFATLRRYIEKRKKNGPNIRLTPNYEVNKIFTDEQENILREYFKTFSLMFYGLSSAECRKVAYDMARLNRIKMPNSWIVKQTAGIEWLRSFRKRHPDIILKKPKAYGLAKAAAFNIVNINKFFDNLHDVIMGNPNFADGSRIYHLDDTEVTVPKDVKNLGKVAINGEKGASVITMCSIINATGQAFPPAIIFPRKHLEPCMLNRALPGTLGLAVTNGQMNSEMFVQVMTHFIKHSTTSPANPSCLIMDNQKSPYLSIKAMDLAKLSGVTILTLPPRLSVQLAVEPLDVGISSLFETYYSTALDSWMLRNPGEAVTIYDVVECVSCAYLQAMTPVNVCNSFKMCGIYPYNRDIIYDNADFLASNFNNLPNPEDFLEKNDTDSLQTTTPNKTYATSPDEDLTQPSCSFVIPQIFCQPIKTEERKTAKRRKMDKQKIKRQVFTEISTCTKRKKIISRENNIESESDDDEEFVDSRSSSSRK